MKWTYFLLVIPNEKNHKLDFFYNSNRATHFFTSQSTGTSMLLLHISCVMSTQEAIQQQQRQRQQHRTAAAAPSDPSLSLGAHQYAASVCVRAHVRTFCVQGLLRRIHRPCTSKAGRQQQQQQLQKPRERERVLEFLLSTL